MIKNYKSIDLIVIVDNCSTDKSYKKINEYTNNKIKLIKSDKNGGYAYGNNFGIHYLIENHKCDIIFIANPDVEFEENLVIEIKRQFEKNTKYSVLSGVMLDINGNVVKAPYWDIPSYRYDLLDYFFIGRRINKKEFKIDYNKKIMDVEVVPGSFLAIKAKVLKDIAYYDEYTILYCEENIFATKLGEPECMFKLGCKGPITKAHCPVNRWNSSDNWPIGDNTTCIGCAGPGFPDKTAPYVTYGGE